VPRPIADSEGQEVAQRILSIYTEVMFVFSEADSRDARELVVPIPGLHPGMVYKIDGSDLRLSGAAWATKGLTIRLKAFESRILTVRCV
jgi:hypothetical protein